MVPLLSLNQAGPAYAVGRKKPRPHAHHYTSEIGVRINPLAANGYSGYYERVLERVPYGHTALVAGVPFYPRN